MSAVEVCGFVPSLRSVSLTARLRRNFVQNSKNVYVVALMLVIVEQHGNMGTFGYHFLA